MHIWIGGRPKQTKGLYLGKEHIKRYLVILKLVFFFVQFNYGFEDMRGFRIKFVM